MVRAANDDSMEEKKRSTRFASTWLGIALAVIAVVVAGILIRIYGGGM